MRKIIGGSLIGLGVLAFIAPMGLPFMGEQAAESWQSITFAFWLAAGFLIFIGRRLAATTAQAALEDDPRPPVLYLRPFRRDAADSIRMLLALFARNRDLGGATREEEFIKRLDDLGPVVAVGKPGEWLPPIGAARTYVPEGSDWKESVRGLMQRAQLVVVRGSGTSGLLWEIREIIATVDPTKIRLVFDSARDYRRFYEWAWPLFPAGLPLECPSSDFLFDADWKPVAPGRPSSEAEDKRTDADKPTDLYARLPLSPLVVLCISTTTLVLSILLSLAVTAPSRGQIPGLWFSIVSIGVVLVLVLVAETTVMAIIERRNQGLLSMGLHIRPSTKTVHTAALLSQSSDYVLADHLKVVFDRASATERSLVARIAADQMVENGRAAGAHTDDVEPFPFRVALNIVGRSEMLSARLASAVFLGLAALAAGAASGAWSPWAVAVVSAILGSATGLIISHRLCRGPISITYWPGQYEGIDPDERSSLDLVRGKPVRPVIRADRRCGRPLASGISRIGASVMALHFVLFLVVLPAAWLIQLMWPAGNPSEARFWIETAVGTVFAGIVYVGAGWPAARIGAGFARRG